MVAKTGAVIFAPSADRSLSPTNIFAPASTTVESIFELPHLVLSTTAATLSVVFSLLAHAVLKFRRRRHGDGREPAQVYESNQLDLAWTILPVLIVLVLFLATAQELPAETSNQT